MDEAGWHYGTEVKLCYHLTLTPVYLPAAPLLIQFPANKPGKLVEDSPSTWVPLPIQDAQ